MAITLASNGKAVSQRRRGAAARPVARDLGVAPVGPPGVGVLRLAPCPPPPRPPPPPTPCPQRPPPPPAPPRVQGGKPPSSLGLSGVPHATFAGHHVERGRESRGP